MPTTTQTKAARLAVKLAALADPARNSNEAERAAALAKLIALCEKHSLNIADYIKPAASPDTGEQPKADKPKAKRAKPEPKPEAKPETSADKRDAERERAQANAAFVRAHYAGPSAASHSARAPKLHDAIERVANPIQRAKSASVRDESGLLLAAKHANGSHDFDPCAATFDLGVLSRLASLGMLSVSPVAGRIRITKAGRDLAANLARKAA
jgi:hypothetical protein